MSIFMEVVLLSGAVDGDFMLVNQRFVFGVVVLLGALNCSDDDDANDPNNLAGRVSDLAAWPQPYQDFIASAGGARFQDVGGALMHYVETGPADGEVVLLVHGIPTQTYLWRNVMPALSDHRVVAVDLIGYGRSERPPGLAYTPRMNTDFLANFIEARGYQRVHLVAHDLGGPVGLRWAFENPQRVASITMFETLWARLSGLDALPPPFGGQGGILASMRSPTEGPQLVGEMNIFLNAFSDFTATGVNESDLAVYRFPWPTAEDRVQVFLPSGPLAFPFPEDTEAANFIGEYEDFLRSSTIPKLVIDVMPGALSGAEVELVSGSTVAQPVYAQDNFPDTTLRALAPAGHFVQEDFGPELGAMIDEFVKSVANR